MLSFRYKGRTIPYLNTSSSVSILSSAVVLVVSGLKGFIGIATDTILPLATGAVSIDGVHELAAKSTDTGVAGDKWYWDNTTNQYLTSTATGNTFAGLLAETKSSGDTTAKIKLPALNLGNALALTDNTGGTAGTTLAATAGTQTFVIPVLLAKLANAQVFSIDPGFAGKITAINFRVGDTPVTTGSKAATVTAQANAASVTGGAVAIASSTATPSGAQIAGSAITGGGTFTAAQTIGVVVSSVTTFSEGSGYIELTVVNTDLASAIASLAAR